MSNSLTPKTSPFGAYAVAMSSRNLDGQLLKFSKGDWLAGVDNSEVPIGTRLAALMPSLRVGWQRWENSRVTESRIGLLNENFQSPRRRELGDDDTSKWPIDADGLSARDPWQFVNQLPLIDPDLFERVFTFTTSSRGGLDAITKLCASYDRTLAQRQDVYPVVELQVGSYQHRDKTRGRIKFPVFNVVGYAASAPLDEALAFARGEPVQLTSPIEDVQQITNLQRIIDDDIPF